MSVAPVPDNAAMPGAEAAAPPARGMTKAESMLFEIEVDEHSSALENQQLPQVLEDGGVEDLKYIMKPRTATDILVHEVSKQVASAVGTAELSSEVMARELMTRLPPASEVKLRSANPTCGGQGAGECLRNLRHTFILCEVEGTQYVVDPCFKEQFSIVHPTPAFESLMAALPRVVVLPADRVAAVVELLCRAMSTAFKAANKEIPPWRRADAMLSKWRPRRSCDVTQIAADAPADAPAGVSSDDAPPSDDNALKGSAHNMYKMVSDVHVAFGLPGMRALARPPTAPQPRVKENPSADSGRPRPNSSPPSRLSEELARLSDENPAANAGSSQQLQATMLGPGRRAYETVTDAISGSLRGIRVYGGVGKHGGHDGLQRARFGRHFL